MKHNKLTLNCACEECKDRKQKSAGRGNQHDADVDTPLMTKKSLVTTDSTPTPQRKEIVQQLKGSSSRPHKITVQNLPLIKKYNPGYDPNNYSSGDEFQTSKPSPKDTKRKLVKSTTLERVEHKTSTSSKKESPVSSSVQKYPTRITYNTKRRTSISSKEESTPQIKRSKEVSSQQKSPEAGPSRLAHSTSSLKRPTLSSSDEDAVVVVKTGKINVKRRRIIISDDDTDESMIGAQQPSTLPDSPSKTYKTRIFYNTARLAQTNKSNKRSTSRDSENDSMNESKRAKPISPESSPSRMEPPVQSAKKRNHPTITREQLSTGMEKALAATKQTAQRRTLSSSKSEDDGDVQALAKKRKLAIDPKTTSTKVVTESHSLTVQQQLVVNEKVRKTTGRYTKKANKDKRAITNVKCTLKQIFQEGPNSDAIIRVINELVIKATKICFVASLAALNIINKKFEQIDWTFFQEMHKKPQKFVVECFYAVTQSTHRKGEHEYITPDFRRLMTQFNIRKETTSQLNNILKSLTDNYEINFKNNIVVNAKKRFTRLLKLKSIEVNSGLTNKELKRMIKNTMDFMFNTKSKCERNDAIIDFILRYIPNRDRIGITNDVAQNRGFMNLFLKPKWFLFIPVFLKLQRHIYNYHLRCRFNLTRIEVRNFRVVPLHSHRRKHIRIDNATFKHILQHLDIHPTKPNPYMLNTKVFHPGKRGPKPAERVALTDTEFNNALDRTGTYNPYWFQFLDWHKIRHMQRQSKLFTYQIVTDGVSVSVEFRSTKNPPQPQSFKELLEKQAEKYDQYGRKYLGGWYDTVIGLDPGYKLYIAAVIKDLRTTDETLLKISSKEFYSMMRQNCRDKLAKKWTHDFEHRAKTSREDTTQYQIYPSPNGPNYMEYIKHSLQFFYEGIDVYTTRKYARLSLDKHIRRQTAMDVIANELVKSSHTGRILICIGGTEFNPSSPIRKYKRCPGTRKIVEFIKKYHECDVMFVDEYKTSQICGRCYRQFDKEKRKSWDRKGIRHRVCDNCQPKNDIISLPKRIFAQKSQRQLNLELLTIMHDMYIKYPLATYDDVKTYIMNIAPKYKFQNRRLIFEKHDLNEQRETLLKCVWNRDTSAARLIMIKAICRLTDTPLPITLQRIQNVPHDADQHTTDSSEDEYTSDSDAP